MDKPKVRRPVVGGFSDGKIDIRGVFDPYPLSLRPDAVAVPRDTPDPCRKILRLATSLKARQHRKAYIRGQILRLMAVPGLFQAEIEQLSGELPYKPVGVFLFIGHCASLLSPLHTYSAG